MPSPFALQDHALIARALDAVPFGLVALSSAGECLYANAWAAARLPPDGDFLAMWDPASRRRIEDVLPKPGMDRADAFDLVAADGSSWRISMEPWRGSAPDGEVMVVSLQPAPPMPLESRRILVVEDDALIRMAICEMLESRGHVAFEAGDGNEALRLHAVEPIDVLLTDVGLPGMNGVELAQRLREAQPGLPVLFATGDHTANGVTCDARTQIIGKPYGVADLMKAIARVAGR